MDYLLSSKSPGFVSTRRLCRARGSITVVVYMVLLQSEQYRSREEERAVRRHGSLQVPSSSQSYVFLDGRIRTDRDGSVLFFIVCSVLFFFSHCAVYLQGLFGSRPSRQFIGQAEISAPDDQNRTPGSAVWPRQLCRGSNQTAPC